MKKILLFLGLSLLVFLGPTTASAFDLWSSAKVQNFSDVEPGTEYSFDPNTPYWFYGIQIFADPADTSQGTFTISCSQGTSPKNYYGIGNGQFIYMSDWCDQVGIASSNPSISGFSFNIWYGREGMSGDSAHNDTDTDLFSLVGDNQNGGSGFFLSKTLSYGDVLVLTFLILFFVWGTFKLLWNYFNKNDSSKL
jgi:hypothetical protein